ncbi:hypothetical protein PR048_005008 [Dryococelus australis]|uniref:Gag protein n=1 Tax=Dryococelus australis TaxID=614101 RepID=A0ABQ9I705_9NEOP|nr:hypothetical protein PR048_005008 [Dryococelus australis]
MKDGFLWEPNLDLIKCIKISSAAKLADIQTRQLKGKSEVFGVQKASATPRQATSHSQDHQVPHSSFTGRGVRNDVREFQRNNSSFQTTGDCSSQSQCKACGKMHLWDTCPSYRKQCHKCDK